VKEKRMTRHKGSDSPRSEDVSDHYASGYEEDRLKTGHGKIDRERSRELLERFLPKAPATILDVGGGPGGHALWLARSGHEVHLVDIVPLHVEQARQASEKQPDVPLASAEVGDACALSWNANTVDVVLMFGPLYHLTDRQDRRNALVEAHRVLKPNGVLLAVGISRFASALDGLRAGFLKDPCFAEIVDQDLKDGQHRNPTDKPEYFMDTFFHHPDELRDEVSDVGFTVSGIYGVEGPSWLVPDIENWWKNETYRQELLRIARSLETEPSLLGVSAHLMAVARKK
jgi:ubiquinone/menaquinone biosynthesis C-methylase UbiE